MESVQKADRRLNPSRYWQLLKNLSRKRVSAPSNQPITFGDKTMTKTLSILIIYKNLKINNPLDRSFTPFSDSDVINAIKASKNLSAAGPNGLTMLHLKHLGSKGIRYLTHLYNLSVRVADIPAIWKSARVVPVPKPGKPADQGTSYSPISLLCPEIKVLERLNLPFLRAFLSPSPSQHGFQP